ncbi:25609_t:CDS:2, partial [Gigaspora rosea]
AGLGAFIKNVTISDVTEDIVAAGKHKNPQVKWEAMKWLVRCLKNTKVAPNKAEIKSLIEMMVKASEDSFEPVRVSAAEGLGTMMKVIGEKAMNPFIEGLDDIKKSKIKEFFEKAEVKVKATAAKRPPTVAPAQTPKTKPKIGAKKDEGSKKDESTEQKKEPPKTSKPATQPPKKATKPPATTAPPKKSTKVKEEETLKYKFSNEEVESRFAELIPEEQTAEMGDKNWKLRLAATENLYNTLNEMDPSNIEAELVVRFLAKKPGWKESNFQPVDVLSKMSKDFYTQLQSTKWKDRKEALDGLLEICKTPRIADNNYGELVGALAKRISDSNILVVTLAANIIEALALGLRESFAKYKTTVTNPLIEKLKERKQSVVDALASALDAIFNT